MTLPTPAGYAVFGAAPDTANLGVGALLISAVAAIDTMLDDAPLTVFDNGMGIRPSELEVGDRSRVVTLSGFRNSRRLHRSDSAFRVVTDGLLRNPSNPVVDTLRRSLVIADVSGGDSFSDIYGWKRYRFILQQKAAAIRSGRPVVLLPQTFGPFESRVARRLAQSVVRRVDAAVARDAWSFEQLRMLLADDFDPARHREGIDLAFALPPAPWSPTAQLHQVFERERPIAGVNVSGLLYLDANSARRFSLADDYRTTVRAVIEALLERTEASILLVPHVVAPVGHPESDIDACQRVLADLPSTPRLQIAPSPSNASEAKGMIATMDWFTGSRMHSTIAALSSGVPTASLAYSVKAAGVFETAGMGDHVSDLRTDTAPVAADRMIVSFDSRSRARQSLESIAPALRRRAVEQVRDAFFATGVVQVGHR